MICTSVASSGGPRNARTTSTTASTSRGGRRRWRGTRRSPSSTNANGSCLRDATMRFRWRILRRIIRILIRITPTHITPITRKTTKEMLTTTFLSRILRRTIRILIRITPILTILTTKKASTKTTISLQ
mmetsp:Transcript_18871/g.58107  ORF Transcript_18871/g.58107 Transcript_18871/m.58107 type:complete len:129 (-) Transcript_18871:1548-1934(-)